MKKILYLAVVLIFVSCSSSRIVNPYDVAVYGSAEKKNDWNHYFIFHNEGHVYESYYKNLYEIGRWEVRSDTLLLMYQYYCYIGQNDSVMINPIDTFSPHREIEKYIIHDKEIILLDNPQYEFKQFFGLDKYFFNSIFNDSGFVPFIQ